jgi:hypothetical protein
MDAKDALAAIVAGVASGALTTREANDLASLVGSFAKVVECEELERRIQELERVSKQVDHKQ